MQTSCCKLVLLKATSPAKKGRRALSPYLLLGEAMETSSDSPLQDNTWREGRRAMGSAG